MSYHAPSRRSQSTSGRYSAPTQTSHDVVTRATRHTIGHYSVAGLGYGPPYLIAPTLGAVAGSPAQMAQFNNALIDVIRPLFGAIDASPLSAADKIKLKTRPFDAIWDIFDPIEDAVGRAVSRVITRKGATQRFFGRSVNLMLNPTADNKLAASTRNIVKRMRIINAFNTLMFTQPIELAEEMGKEGLNIAGHLAQGAADAVGEAWNAFTGLFGGNGSQNAPFGGVGGAPESQLRNLARAGLTFKSPGAGLDLFQEGALNGEKYVFVKGVQDGKFYKFKMTGTGIGNTPSDAAASSWFDNVVANARASMSGFLSGYGTAGLGADPVATPAAVAATGGAIVWPATAEAWVALITSIISGAGGATGLVTSFLPPGVTIPGIPTQIIKPGTPEPIPTEVIPPPVKESSGISPAVLVGGALAVVAVAFAMSKRK